MAVQKQIISVVVPVYNEIDNISSFHKALITALNQTKRRYEIIYVDDRSSDGTFEWLVSLKTAVGITKKSLKKQIKNDMPLGSLTVFRKAGTQGKAYSLIEGFEKATGTIFIMIDADLQYPPSAIPEMIQKLHDADIVVANRKNYKESLLRRTMTKTFRFVFGRMLFNLSTDVQSGLKVFTKEVYNTVKFTPVSPWTFDLEFLHRALHSGFDLVNYDITFSERLHGISKVSLISSSIEIAVNAIQVKFKKVFPLIIPSVTTMTMRGAGIGYKKRKYVMHTTLPFSLLAIQTFTVKQLLFIFTLLALFVIGLFVNYLRTLQLTVAILSLLYLADTLFNFSLVIRSLQKSKEITSTSEEIKGLDSESLPVYTVLCPLYKEAHVVSQFVDSISNVDWPKEKLDVMLLLEEDDKETIAAIKKMELPFFVRSVIVPDSLPKTKPKACNFGLSYARGEYLVIFDAEDMPDPLQLKKAYLAFQKVPKTVKCLQAKLNFYNPSQNLLTRFFTAEYTLWFDLTLTGLQSYNSTIPLGGTSNHFRTADLHELQGWDPFNVTEDADLGVRLFHKGYQTAIIDSTTYEEANSNFQNWIRQRSRWIKGYMQTYLVHMRNMSTFTKSKGIKHTFIFQLTIGGKLLFIMLNPCMWIITLLYFVLYPIFGPTIEAIYIPPISYIAAFSWVFGNFLFFYVYMIACANRKQWSLLKYIYLIPVYWLMMSLSAGIALYQLIIKPHYWEKTVHGLHLKSNESTVMDKPFILRPSFAVSSTVFEKARNHKYVRNGVFGGGFLVIATVIAHMLNLSFNLYLGKTMDLENFGFISLFSGLFFLSAIPFSALNTVVNYKSGFLEGKLGAGYSFSFWKFVRKNSFYVAIMFSIIWLMLSPLLTRYFNSADVSPFILFIPVWLVGFVFSVDKGYMTGKLMFAAMGLLTVIEPTIKFISAIVLTQLHLYQFVYLSIPISFIGAFLCGWLILTRKSSKQEVVKPTREIRSFPKKFFFVSIISSLSSITFMSMDIILAKHYLSANAAGEYALISLVGKMIFFLGDLSSQFITPLVSRNEGRQKNSISTFSIILLFTFLLSDIGFIVFGLFGNISLPILFGQAKAAVILPYIMLFSFAILCFTISRVFVFYYLTIRKYTFPIVSFVLVGLQFLLISVHHENVGAIVSAMMWTGGLNLLVMVGLHLGHAHVANFEKTVSEWFTLRTKSSRPSFANNNLAILIFNWRDIKHTWAGGAEVYVHELAKRWVKEGNRVTIFCSNDRLSANNQVIDGVNIIRRGGTYTVYMWAFIYYVLYLRKKFDVIVDCENGIPFFTPLYSRKPIFLVVHHVHQEIFRAFLRFPANIIAELLEGELMPLLYSNKSVITVSESSKKEIIKLGLVGNGDIQIVPNGVADYVSESYIKTSHPSFIYFGRLKEYKNIDVAIKAFSKILKQYPQATFTVAGFGESLFSLRKLVDSLGITSSVDFLGRVAEKDKARVYATHWVMVQPSQMEGWGITVLEANSAGTPVIASNVNGLQDSVVNGKTGILVERGNVTAFAEAMKKIIEDKEYREKLSSEAYLWSRNFSWDKSAMSFYMLIDHSLRGSTKGFETAFNSRLIFAKVAKE